MPVTWMVAPAGPTPPVAVLESFGEQIRNGDSEIRRSIRRVDRRPFQQTNNLLDHRLVKQQTGLGADQVRDVAASLSGLPIRPDGRGLSRSGRRRVPW